MNHLKSTSFVTWSIFSGFVLLLYFFCVINVYEHHFFSKGIVVIGYNLARICFIFYLTWLFYSVGDWVLSYCSSEKLSRDSALQAVFTGVGVWQLGLFAIGLAGLYQHAILISLSTVIFILSLPKLNRAIQQIFHDKHSFYWPGILLITMAGVLFLLTKGLYPAGGHDYYNHYFHFYRKVIDSGSILPNEVWYHFYYSKGAGIFFLGMLLTDPLAPQLVTTTMMFAGAAVIYSLLNRTATWRLFPWIGATLYLFVFIYTPGPLENMRNGGWGDLEKLHEPAAVLILCILWATINLVAATQKRSWGITLIFSIISLILMSPAMICFSVPYLGLMFIYLILSQKKQAAFWIGCGIFAASLLYGTIVIINYYLTGVPEDQTILSFWPWIDFEKIKNWGVLLEFYILHYGKTGLVANKIPLTTDLIYNILTYLRLDVWGVLFLLSGSCVIIHKLWHLIRYQSLASKFDKPALYCCGAFLLTVIALSVIIGRDQPISFYRMTTFTYAPMLCFCLLLLSSLRNRLLMIAVPIIAVIVPLNFNTLLNTHLDSRLQKVAESIEGHYDFDIVKQIIANSQLFVMGNYSIADAYQNQQGWPGRMPWGGIYPPTKAIWEQLPPKTRIWSMHVHSYCMLPNCHMEGYQSFRLSHQPQKVYFGEPAEAKSILKKEGLNYFFFAKSLQLTDPLPRSALFSPEHIADFLGIAWTDGDNTLLTWKELAKEPISAAWIEDYKKQISSSIQISSFPYDALKIAFDQSEKNTYLDTDLPWYQAGWS